MTNKDRLAREAIIQRLIAGWPSWALRATQGHIDAFVDASADYSLEALRKAQERFHSPDGVPGRDRNSWPSASEFAAQARLFEPRTAVEQRARPEIIAYPRGALPPAGYEPLGPIKLEVRGRTVDVSRLTHRQKLEVMRTGKLPAPPNATVPKMRQM